MKVEFVEFIPENLSDGVLYISMKYKCARHKCACGCGNIVITPITPTDWQLKYDGRGVTLNPSIGNWNFPCRSHYWIIGSDIRWSGQWYKMQIENGRHADKERKKRYFEKAKPKPKYTYKFRVVDYIKRFLKIKLETNDG
jgi:hypothetical protein